MNVRPSTRRSWSSLFDRCTKFCDDDDDPDRWMYTVFEDHLRSRYMSYKRQKLENRLRDAGDRASVDLAQAVVSSIQSATVDAGRITRKQAVPIQIGGPTSQLSDKTTRVSAKAGDASPVDSDTGSGERVRSVRLPKAVLEVQAKQAKTAPGPFAQNGGSLRKLPLTFLPSLSAPLAAMGAIGSAAGAAALKGWEWTRAF